MKRVFVLGVVLGWWFAHASQDTTCNSYVTCFEATGGTKGQLDSTYGASGTCWTTTARTNECLATCVSELNALAAKFPDAGCKDVLPPRGCGI